MPSLDSFKARQTLTVNGKDYTYYSLDAAAKNGLGDVSKSHVAWKLAKLDGVRELPFARAKKRRQVHCAAVRSDWASSVPELRPIWISSSAMRSEDVFGGVMRILVSNRNYFDNRRSICLVSFRNQKSLRT